MRAARAILVRREKAPGGGPHAEHVEVVAGHQLREHALRLVGRFTHRQAERQRRRVAGEIAEHAVPLAEIFQVRIDSGSRLPNWVALRLATVSTPTSSDGFSTGSGFRNSVLSSVKIVVLAPMPSASDRIAAIVNAGVLISVRIAYRMSFMTGW